MRFSRATGLTSLSVGSRRSRAAASRSARVATAADGFNVDPLEPNRVWYIARGRGTNTGPFLGGMPATGKAFVNPPQACSLTFDADGLVTKYTIGYVIDRTVGNTGGLGGIYGILYAIGRPLPFPEANPWRKSLPYWAFQEAGGLLAKLGGLGGGGK